MAHDNLQILFQERRYSGLENHLLNLVHLPEIVFVGADGAVVIPFNQELLPGKLFQQMAGVFTLEEGKVPQNIYRIPLVNG